MFISSPAPDLKASICFFKASIIWLSTFSSGQPDFPANPCISNIGVSPKENILVLRPL